MGVHVSRVTEDAPEWLRDLDHTIHIAKVTAIVAVSIAAWDWFACLDEEIDLLWSASHSLFKYLALATRYLGLVYAIGVTTLRLGDWSHAECRRLKPIASVTSSLVILTCDYVLALR